jgi:putative ABC transport system substrate-binding protein
VRIDRRAFIAAAVGGLLPVPLAVEGQQAGEIRRIGFLAGGSAGATARSAEVFRQGLKELGWIEGQNLVIDWRFAEGRHDRLPDLAAELVRLKVSIIVAGPTPPAVAAKSATGTIPIVMANAADPLELGLVASLARPGGNVTGLAFSVNLEIFGKGLELLKEAVPRIRRVAVLWNPANPAQASAMGHVKAAARSLGMQLQPLPTRGPDEFDGAFAAMARERAEGLLVVAEALFVVHRDRLAGLAAKHRLPSMHGLRENVEAGGLMSYGPSIAASWRRAAVFVDKILKGARPADLPVEQPTTFELVINLRTAKALGLTIPSAMLARADTIIE